MTFPPRKNHLTCRWWVFGLRLMKTNSTLVLEIPNPTLEFLVCHLQSTRASIAKQLQLDPCTLVGSVGNTTCHSYPPSICACSRKLVKPIKKISNPLTQVTLANANKITPTRVFLYHLLTYTVTDMSNLHWLSPDIQLDNSCALWLMTGG